MLMSGRFSSQRFVAHLGDVGGVGDPAQIIKCRRCRGGREARDGGLERGHDGEAGGLADGDEPDRDRDLAVHGGGEIAESVSSSAMPWAAAMAPTAIG